MELEKVLSTRTSVRQFTKDKITSCDIDKLLQAAMTAPSAMDKRPWEFYAITSEKMLQTIRGAMPYGKYNAPLIIVVAVNDLRALPLSMHDFSYCDAGAATENILLEATNLGLGAVWCGVWPQKARMKALGKALNLSPLMRPFAAIYIGHPAGITNPKNKYNKNRIHLIQDEAIAEKEEK